MTAFLLTAARPCRDERQVVSCRWRPRRHRGERAAQAATAGAASRPTAGAKPDGLRPALMRIRGALPADRTHPEGRPRVASFDTPGVPGEFHIERLDCPRARAASISGASPARFVWPRPVSPYAATGCDIAR